MCLNCFKQSKMPVVGNSSTPPLQSFQKELTEKDLQMARMAAIKTAHSLLEISKDLGILGNIEDTANLLKKWEVLSNLVHEYIKTGKILSLTNLGEVLK